MTTDIWVGIDGCKTHLDVAIRPNGEEFQLPNAIGVTLVVLEATGGLEYQVSGSLLEAGIGSFW